MVLTLRTYSESCRQRIHLNPRGRGCSQAAASEGSILIGLVITMVIFAALGAAMLPLTNTSTLSQVGVNQSTRAYFLAESGYRYAAGEYKNAPNETAKDNQLQTMHTQGTYTLQNNSGRFQLEIYPFYFKTRLDPNGTQILNTEVKGGFPPDLSLSTGRLLVNGNYYDYTSASQSGANVDFTTVQTLPSITVGTDVLSVALSANLVQTVANGGELELQAGYINAFPERNGTFDVDGHTYSYREKDAATDKLLGIQDPSDPNMVSFNVAANSEVVLQKFIRVYSTGTFGQGPTAVSRQIRYHVPLPLPEAETKVEYHETFDNLTNWTATVGSQAIQSIGGDNALRVTGVNPPFGGGPVLSQITLTWQNTDVDLNAAFNSAGKYLSYDAQVKIGFVGSPAPDWGFNPSPIPLYYGAGINFRLDSDDNSYGLSFLRGSNSAWPTPDNLINEIVPLDQRNLIVLWQQTNAGIDRAWLAYKYFSSYAENVENGLNGWTTGGSNPGLWHINDTRSASPDHAWHYGQWNGFGWDYNTGSANDGWLMSPPVDLSVCSPANARLRFWSWYDTETLRPAFDEKKVQISTNNGATWSDLHVYDATNLDHAWERLEFNLAAYLGQTIRVRFVFDTIDAVDNNHEGWYIDDVTIGDFPNESTLMVRIQESASITFDTGGNIAPNGGDTVIGQTSGARGKIVRDPMLASGSWAGSDAAGVMTLNNVTGTFQVGELVTATASSTQVTVLSYSARDNFIRAYYGSASACGTPSSEYRDEDKLSNPRTSLNWPPDNVAQWEAANDYFTLIQWDAINPVLAYDLSTNPSGTMVLVNAVDESRAVIRSWEPELLTQSFGTFSDVELALHATGKGALNVYFDDFGLQAIIGKGSGATPPIQE